MKKLTIFLTLLLIVIASRLVGQDVAVVRGRVLDEKNMQPLAFANVSLHLQKDSSLLAGVITNDLGEFDIPVKKSDSYFIKVSNMGYQNKLVDKIEINGHTKLDVGNISLSPAEIALGEVNVIGEKLKGQEKVDRTVYAIPANVKSVSNSGLDVLKHIPAVNVDLKENVSLEGRTDIVFYVDGVQRDKDFVSQLDPAAIDRVEIMTNPSSKYGADISGVIQVFLVKDKPVGISGRFSADIPSPPTYLISPGASLDYGFKNIRIYVSDRMHLEKFNGFQETNTIRKMDGDEFQQLNLGKGNFSMMNNNFKYGMDWFINDKNSLNFFGNVNYYDFKFNDFLYDSWQLLNNEQIGKESITQDLKNKGKSNYYSLYYKRLLEKNEGEFSVQTSFYDYTGQDYQFYTHQQINLLSNEPENEYTREEIVNNTRKSIDVTADYSQVSGKSRIEAGIKTYYQWFDNEQPLASDANRNFIYDEVRLASYINFQYTLEKFSIQGGLRTEMSKTDINNEAENNYLAWLPQVSLIRKLKEGQNLKLNLRRRIYRPGIDELNPFEVWTDSLHMQKGNPNLKPAYSNDAELVYSKNFNSSMISPKIYVKYKTGDFQRENFINEEGVVESYTQNIGKALEYGLAMNFALKLTKWWMMNGYGRVYKSVIYDNENSSDILSEKLSYQTDFSSIMTFFKSWNFMMMMNYRSPYISYQQTHYRDMLFILALEKEIFKNAKCQLMYLPPYTKKFTFERNETQTEELVNSWKAGVNFDYLFVVQFSYSFRSGKKVKSLDRPVDYDSDTNKGLF